jgi:uncharacterized membrane protein YidH (DUF202 family)
MEEVKENDLGPRGAALRAEARRSHQTRREPERQRGGGERRVPAGHAGRTRERADLPRLASHRLALVAVGVAAERVLPAQGTIWARQLIGVSLILAGVLTAGLARRRWRMVDRAVRAGHAIPRPILGYVVAAAIVVDGLATIVLLLRADAG